MDNDNFFVTLMMKDGAIFGHSISFGEDKIPVADKELSLKKEEQPSVSIDVNALNFEEIFNSYTSVMRTYRSFIPLTLNLAPVLSTAIAEKTIGAFARRRGTKRDDLSNDTRLVYELHPNTLREVMVYQEEILASFRGAQLLPEVMIIGLVSAYDAFLGALLRLVFTKHDDMVLTSEKTIKFSDLAKYTSIEEARQSLIEREVESVLRESHQQHFDWMEEKFKLKLKSDLPIFPVFVELCERRNLLTHAGGIISSKYLSNCAEHGFDVSNIIPGTKVRIDNNYYSQAVDAISEIGIKLSYVLWSKFSKHDRDKADDKLNEYCYDLIVGRAYRLAEAILKFSAGVLKKRGKDYTRRMMLINLANAVRLQKREEEAKQILECEDWTSCSDDLRISVAAVKGDTDLVIELLNKIGTNGRPNAEDYRTWPVFRGGIRTNPKFKQAFQSMFGESVIVPRTVEIPEPTIQISAEIGHE